MGTVLLSRVETRLPHPATTTATVELPCNRVSDACRVVMCEVVKDKLELPDTTSEVASPSAVRSHHDSVSSPTVILVLLQAMVMLMEKTAEVVPMAVTTRIEAPVSISTTAPSLVAKVPETTTD